MVESYGNCIHTQVDINRTASPQVRGAESGLPVPGARLIGRALFMMIKVLAWASYYCGLRGYTELFKIVISKVEGVRPFTNNNPIIHPRYSSIDHYLLPLKILRNSIKYTYHPRVYYLHTDSLWALLRTSYFVFRTSYFSFVSRPFMFPSPRSARPAYLSLTK